MLFFLFSIARLNIRIIYLWYQNDIIEDFVMIQSDAALRQVVGQYAYDDSETNTEELTLRSSGEEINEQFWVGWREKSGNGE